MRRRTARGILLALGGSSLAIGGWALFAPADWFARFPGAGRTWTALLPPFNEHLARDVGAFNLMLGALFLWVAVELDPRAVRAVCLASLLFAVPHTIFHAANLSPFGRVDQIAQMATLSLTVLGPLAVVWLTPSRAAPAE